MEGYAVLFTVVAVVTLWCAEILVLGLNGWKVSRSTPVSMFTYVPYEGFCTVLWKVGFIYWLCSFMLLGISYILINFGFGVIELIQGANTDRAVIATVIIPLSVLALDLSVIVWSVKYFWRKVTGIVYRTKETKIVSVVKEIYKSFKDKYCPIITEE